MPHRPFYYNPLNSTLETRSASNELFCIWDLAPVNPYTQPTHDTIVTGNKLVIEIDPTAISRFNENPDDTLAFDYCLPEYPTLDGHRILQLRHAASLLFDSDQTPDGPLLMAKLETFSKVTAIGQHPAGLSPLTVPNYG